MSNSELGIDLFIRNECYDLLVKILNEDIVLCILDGIVKWLVLVLIGIFRGC